MPYALCPMPYAVRVPHLSEKGYIMFFVRATKRFILCLGRKQALHDVDELLRFKGFADVSVCA